MKTNNKKTNEVTLKELFDKKDYKGAVRLHELVVDNFLSNVTKTEDELRTDSNNIIHNINSLRMRLDMTEGTRDFDILIRGIYYRHDELRYNANILRSIREMDLKLGA